ncbi:MAG TPA: hypothetical protein VFR05_02640, partial [Terriglobia bacterium]|nr:hypothetical protein [Terriglobia bacterium]
VAEGRGGVVKRAFLLALACVLLLPTLAFAQYRTINVESLQIVLDTEWPQVGTVGYYPVRIDITNQGEAREIEVRAFVNHWFDPSRRSRAPRSFFGGNFDTGRADVRQRIALKSGDNKKLTLAVPIIADNESIRISFYEDGEVLDQSNYVNFQGRRYLNEAGALIVSSPSSNLAATVGLRPLASRGGPYAYTTAPRAAAGSSGPKMDHALEPSRLPNTWLGYTSVRSVVLGPTEWSELNPAQQDALLTWTAAGGDLIFADGPLEMLLPPGQRPVGIEKTDSTRPYFLGNIHLPKSWEIRDIGLDSFLTQLDSAVATPDWSLPTARSRDWAWVAERGFRLPITGVGYIPTRAYLSILTLFVALIGPLNYIYLWRRRRQVLMVLTVPLISAAFIVLLAGYGILSQGFDVKSRAVTFTVLDQNSKKAATRVSASLYPGGVTPSGGLRFPSDTAVFSVGVDGLGAREMNLDFTGEQRYTSGLLVPRTPSNFEQAMFQPARQRLNFERNGDQVSVVNGLGVPIQQLFYRDAGRTYVLSGEVAAGDRAPLKLDSSKAGIEMLRSILDNIKLTPISPIKFRQVVEQQPEGTYLALLESSPFWDPGVAKVRESESIHLVFGFPGDQP